MTVYTGDVTAALAFLQTTVNAAGDLHTTDALTRATLSRASSALAARLDDAAGILDPQISQTGAGGLATVTAGAFAPDTAAALLAQIGNLTQAAALHAMRGYAGRVMLNLAEAG